MRTPVPQSSTALHSQPPIERVVVGRDPHQNRERLPELERQIEELEEDLEYFESELANAQRVAREGRDQIVKLQHLLKESVDLNDALEKMIERLETEVGSARQKGWDDAFRTLDPTFLRIESALHCKAGADFVSLMGTALSEYRKVAPPFVLAERNYLTAKQTSQVLRVGRDRLRKIPRSVLNYSVRGGGTTKEHRRYAKADVLRYAAEMAREKRVPSK